MDLAPMTKLARVFVGAGDAEAVWAESCDASEVLRGADEASLFCSSPSSSVFHL
jgi:hypothetical protein